MAPERLSSGPLDISMQEVSSPPRYLATLPTHSLFTCLSIYLPVGGADGRRREWKRRERTGIKGLGESEFNGTRWGLLKSAAATASGRGS